MDKNDDQLLEKYKIAVDFVLSENQVIWNFSTPFIIANSIFVAFISDGYSKSNQEEEIIFYISIVGLLISILWLITAWRRWTWYKFRISQAKNLELNIKGLELVSGTGDKFHEGSKVEIRVKKSGDKQLEPFHLNPVLQLLNSPRIFYSLIVIFIIIYTIFIYQTNPLKK